LNKAAKTKQNLMHFSISSRHMTFWPQYLICPPQSQAALLTDNSLVGDKSPTAYHRYHGNITDNVQTLPPALPTGGGIKQPVITHCLLITM